MHLFEPHLLKDERILYVTDWHWMYVFRALLPFLVVFSLGTIAWSIFKNQLLSVIFMGLVVVSIIWIAMKVMDTMAIKAYVTNQRLIYRKGWTSRNTVDVTLDRIGGVHIYQDVWQRFYGYGKVQVILPVVEIILPRYLRNPQEFRCALYIRKDPVPVVVEEPESDDSDGGDGSEDQA